MTSKRVILGLAAAAAVGVASFPAHAGGPLYMFQPGVPYRWDVTTPVPVYTDLGDLCDTNPDWPYGGCLSNEQLDAAVARGFGQWTAVPTSSFQAVVAGDFNTAGIGEVDGGNAGNVIGAWNGGGYHVMYDSDGSILRDFFGVPYGVLGISSPEWADENGHITESWAVISANAVPEGDDGSMVGGVMTHEFGHGINLAHSQANGHITFFGAPWYWIAWAPKKCSAPYDVSPIDDWFQYQDWIFNTMIPNTETMYPYIQPRQTGAQQSTVDRPDDITALSNLYPAAGWPASRGSISGEIRLKDGQTGLTGVNVVARNVADPLGDVITVMSGDQTQGVIGPDGRFTINGLKPGAEYVVYVENIYAGGFPTPPAALPSFQEYWNGARESADAMSDDPCAWETIAASAGSRTEANIAFNGFDRAPTYVHIPVSSATDANNSGRIIVGTYGGEVAWRYDSKFETFDAIPAQGSPKLARDGNTMIANLSPAIPPWEGGQFEPGRWSPQKGWMPMAMPAGEEGCDGMIMSPYDLTADGNTVVGLAYKNGCPHGSWHPDGLNKFYGGLWREGTGLTYLETPDVVFKDQVGCSWNIPTGCEVNGSRANAISGNGQLVVGHVDAAGWKGAAWVNGKFRMMGADDPKGWIGSANDVNYDGTVAVGGGAGTNDWGVGEDAYLWSPSAGTKNLGHFTVPCEEIAPWDCEWMPEVVMAAEGFGVSDKGDLVVGRAGDFWNGFRSFMWTRELGMVDFDEFLRNQGIVEAYTNELISPLAVSGDGKTIVGWGFNDVDTISFAVTLDQVWVCNGGKSQLVGFPGGMASLMKKGAEPGLCPADRVLAPN